MKQKISTILFALVAFMFIQVSVSPSEVAFAKDITTPTTPPASGSLTVPDAPTIKDYNGTQDDGVKSLNAILFKFVQTISWLVMGIAALVIVYAGFKYATSQGEPRVVEQAKMQIVNAAIGLFISLFTLLILKIFVGVVGGNIDGSEIKTTS